MQVEQFLEQSAQRYPDKTALISDGRRWTYGELETASNAVAHALLDAGVRRGDRVAVFLENSAELVISLFAILKAGGVFLILNPTTKAAKVRYVVDDARAVCLVSHIRKSKVLERVLEVPGCPQIMALVGSPSSTAIRHEGTAMWLEDVLADGATSAGPPGNACIDIDLAALIYTSGSTGYPKGVMMTHLNMVSAADSVISYLENTHEDVILNVLPMSFDYGLYQVLMAFRFGGTVVLERSFAFPQVALSRIENEHVTGFPVVPTMVSILLRFDLSRHRLESLRYISNTGAALPVAHIRALRTLLPHVQIFSMYGLTECKRVSYLPPNMIDVLPSSVGKAIPNEEVYIVDDEGRRVGPGVVGELVVRGSNVMKGYWGLPDETSMALRPGPLPGESVLHSGDLFRMDDQGFLFFVGRRDDIIKTRGEKVSPKEIENVLHEISEIEQAAVVGVDDDVLGQAIWVFVCLKPGHSLSPREIMRYCSESLEAHMVPQYVDVCDELPLTNQGKLDRKALADEAAHKARDIES